MWALEILLYVGSLQFSSLAVIKFITLFSGRNSSRIPEKCENHQKCLTVSAGELKKKYAIYKERQCGMQSERHKTPPVASFGENII